MNALSLDVALILGPLLAALLIFDQWANRQDRRIRQQRTSLEHDREHGRGVSSARPGGVDKPVVTRHAPALRVNSCAPGHHTYGATGGVYDREIDPELVVALFRAELDLLPETEEPAR